MAKIQIEIVSSSSGAATGLAELNEATQAVGETQTKVAKTEEEKWKEAAERNKRKKDWTESQNKLEEEAAQAGKKRANILTRAWTSLDDNVKKVQGGWANFNAKIEATTGMIGMVTGAVVGAYDKIKELVEGYEKVNNQMTILRSQAVWGDIKIQFDQLEEATGGVIDKLDILESVNKAVSFGIDLSGDKLLKLVDVSRKAALNMGTDVKYAFDSLIVGTARESKMILDNLGVMVDIVAANEKYAASIGKTADQLTEEESKVALLNDVLKELGRTQKSIEDDTLKTIGTGLYARVGRAWRDVKLGLGEFFSTTAEYFNNIFVDSAERGSKKLNNAMKEESIRINEMASEYTKVIMDLGVSDQRMINFLKEEETLYQKHKSIIEEIGSRKSLQAEAQQIVNENAMMSNGRERSQERQKYILLQTMEEKYGEKVRATFELQIAKGENAFELAKKRGEVEDDAEFDLFNFLKGQNNQITMAIESSIAWANKLAIVKDAFEQMWDTMQEESVSILGVGSGDGAIDNMKMQDEKNTKLLNAIRTKRVETKIKDEEKAVAEYLKKKKEWDIQELDLAQEIARQDYQNAKDWEYEKIKMKEDALEKTKAVQQEHLEKMRELDRKQNLQNMYDVAESDSEKLKYLSQMSANQYNEVRDREKYIADITDEVSSKTFDDKWNKMIEFENKYNTDLKLSGEDVNKLTKEQLDERLSEEEQYYEVKNQMQEMSVRAAADFTSMLINDVLLGEKEFRKEMIGDFVKGIGTQMVADGTFHIFSGIAKGWGGDPTGWVQAKAGAVEVGVGVGLGATAKAIGTSGGSESKSKETASADRVNNNTNGRDQMQVYLYPSQKYYLRTHNNANKKLGYKK